MTKGKLGKEAQKALVSLFITIWCSLKDGERAFVSAAEARQWLCQVVNDNLTEEMVTYAFKYQGTHCLAKERYKTSSG